MARASAPQRVTCSSIDYCPASSLIPTWQVNGRQEPAIQELANYGQLLCSCRTLYDPGRAMIACDRCAQWFHGDCAGLDLDETADVSAAFVCPACLLEERFPPESLPADGSGGTQDKALSSSRAKVPSATRDRGAVDAARAPAAAATTGTAMRETGRGSNAAGSGTKRTRGSQVAATAAATSESKMRARKGLRL